METKIVDADVLLENSDSGHWICCAEGATVTYCGIDTGQTTNGWAPDDWQPGCIVCHDIEQNTPLYICPVHRMFCFKVHQLIERGNSERSNSQ